MSYFGSRFLLAKPAGCKVAGCAHPHPFAQVHRLMIEPDWLMKEPPAGSFLPSLPSKLRHRHPSSLTEVGWHEGSTERSPWRLAVLRKLWYKAVQKINGCSGMIHLKCHRCNTLLRIDLSFRRKKWPPKTINRVHCTLNMDCSHRATGRHLRVMYET